MARSMSKPILSLLPLAIPSNSLARILPTAPLTLSVFVSPLPSHRLRVTTASHTLGYSPSYSGTPSLHTSVTDMNTEATPTERAITSAETNLSEEEVVVQYVVLRRDLIDTWPLGSVVTQGCHASVAAIWLHKDDPSTLSYCSPTSLDSMHKVTLEVKGETQIVNLSEKLKSNGILHKLWIEQPENIPTCVATKPYPKSVVSPFFKKLKLCK